MMKQGLPAACRSRSCSKAANCGEVRLGAALVEDEGDVLRGQRFQQALALLFVAARHGQGGVPVAYFGHVQRPPAADALAVMFGGRFQKAVLIFPTHRIRKGLPAMSPSFRSDPAPQPVPSRGPTRQRRPARGRGRTAVRRHLGLPHGDLLRARLFALRCGRGAAGVSAQTASRPAPSAGAGGRHGAACGARPAGRGPARPAGTVLARPAHRTALPVAGNGLPPAGSGLRPHGQAGRAADAPSAHGPALAGNGRAPDLQQRQSQRPPRRPAGA